MLREWQRWTDAEVETLRRLIEVEHMRYRDAATALGRSLAAVTCKCSDVGITLGRVGGRRVPPKKSVTRHEMRPWTDAEMETLRRLIEAERLSHREAAAVLGRSLGALMRKCTKAGISCGRVGRKRAVSEEFLAAVARARAEGKRWTEIGAQHNASPERVRMALTRWQAQR